MSFLLDVLGCRYVELLARRGDVESLIEALSHPKTPVVVRAAMRLGQLKDHRAVEPLIALLGNQEWSVSWYAADALGDIGDVRAVEPLIKALRAPHPERVPGALVKLKDPRAVEPLIGALQTTPRFGQEAAEALGEIGDARAVRPLIALLSDRIGSIYSDWKYSRKYEKAEVDEWWWSLVHALEKIGTPSVEPLIEVLSGSGDYGQREGAINALGRIRDVRAVQPLIEVITRHFPSHAVDAAHALMLIGDPRAEEAFKFMHDKMLHQVYFNDFDNRRIGDAYNALMHKIRLNPSRMA